jgi:hypothetical protein
MRPLRASYGRCHYDRMNQGESTNQAISKICSSLDTIKALAVKRGREADFNAIVHDLLGNGDRDGAVDRMSELLKGLGAGGFLESRRGRNPLEHVTDGHPNDEAYICPGEPPTCNRVTIPGAGEPRCALHDKGMRLLRLDQ